MKDRRSNHECKPRIARIETSACFLSVLSLRSVVELRNKEKATPKRGLVRARNGKPSLFDDRQDVFFRHDEQFIAIDGHFVTGVRREQHAVAFLDLEGGPLAVVEQLAVADAQDLALPRLFLGRIGQHDAAGRLLFRLQPFHHDLVVQGDDFHVAGTSKKKTMVELPLAAWRSERMLQTLSRKRRTTLPRLAATRRTPL